MSNLINFLFNIQTASAQGLTSGAVTGETKSQLTSLMDFFVVKIPSFIAAFVVFLIFYFLAKAVKGIVENKVGQNMEEHKEVQILAGRTASTTTIIIGATVALNIAGIDLTAIIAAVGFGVGFALKDIIINFFAGIMILAQKQFTIGDFIHVEGTVGKIVEIQSRATILQALDGTRVVVPNAELFMKQVTSYTSNVFRRVEIPVGVEYDTDLNLAVETCYKALKTTNGILAEPKPIVLVDGFGDSSINLKIRAWVESRGGWLKIKSDLAISIKREFDKVGIGIPFPINTVVFDKDKAEDQLHRAKLREKALSEAIERSNSQETKSQGPTWLNADIVKAPVFAPATVPVQDNPSIAQVAQVPQAVQSTSVPAEQNTSPVVPAAPVVQPKVVTNTNKDQRGAAFLNRQQ